jgi:hypothetical protein
MVTQALPAEPPSFTDHSARTTILRPDEAMRHLAADLDKISSVVEQTETLGWKVVDLSQSLANIQPAMIEATSNLFASDRKLVETSDRVLAAVEIMEMAQRKSMEALNKRLRTLIGLVYWALALGSCAMAGNIIAVFAYFSRAH